MNGQRLWQVIVPRVFLLMVALLGVQYLLGIAARNATLRHGENLPLGRVDVTHARVSLIDRTLRLNDLRLATPGRPDQNWLAADQCELDLAFRPLLHKRAVIERGRLSGLRLGEIPPVDTIAGGSHDKTARWFDDSVDHLAHQTLLHLEKQFETQLIDDLASVKRVNTLCERWPSLYADLEERGARLERQAHELQDASEAAQSNPLRSDKFYAQLPAKVAELQQDFADYRADVSKLPELLDAERRAIVAARRDDEVMLRDRLRAGNIDGNVLSTYLLKEQVSEQLDELIRWLRWVRRTVPAQAAPAAKPARGADVMFAGSPQLPGMLIQSLQLHGATRIGGQPVEFRGTLTDLASTPALHREPMRLRINTSGSLPLEMQATIDRTSGEPADQVLVDCHGLVLPQMEIGRPDHLQLALAPSRGTLSISIAVRGNQLNGDIQLVQKHVRMTPVLNGDLTGAPLLAALDDSLAPINSLATRLSLSGTLQEPKCQLWSNLGTAVAEALARSERRIHDAQVRALLVAAQQRVDERLAELDRQVAAHQQKLTGHVTSVRGSLSRIASDTRPRYRMPAEKIGRRLPENSLFR
jgi:uncharacterized protein (TIGR03545 family)